MNPTRKLRFEWMEPRIALSADAPAHDLDSDLGNEPANASDLLEQVRSLIEASSSHHEIDPAIIADLIERYSSSRSINRLIEPVVQSPAWGDSPAVQFRVEMLDEDQRAVTSPTVGQTYLARVFIRDARSAGVRVNDRGGVFQAIVDLEFSPNVRLIDEVRLSDRFDGQRLTRQTDLDAGVIRNLGGMMRSLSPPGIGEQFLFDARFVVDDTNVSTRLTVTPSTTSAESVLVHGALEAVPIENIAAGALVFPRSPNLEIIVTPSGESDLDRNIIPPIRDRILPANDVPIRPSQLLVSVFRDDESVRWTSFGINPLDRKSRRMDIETEPDDWSELPWPQESFDSADSAEASLNEKNPDAGDAENEEVGDSDQDGTGLFYDENLFLDGAIVETFRSRFRLQMQALSPPRQSTTSPDPAGRDWIDLADILRRRSPPQPWSEKVDEAIAMKPPPNSVNSSRDNDAAIMSMEADESGESPPINDTNHRTNDEQNQPTQTPPPRNLGTTASVGR